MRAKRTRITARKVFTNHESRDTKHGLFTVPLAVRHFFPERTRPPPKVFTNHETRITKHGFYVFHESRNTRHETRITAFSPFPWP